MLLKAIELARHNVQAGGGPFGALIVLNDPTTGEGQIVGEGTNRVTANNDPTAHAEVVAIRQACARLNRFSLAGAHIFTSCEPCPMCLGAIHWARLDKIWFAATRQDAARIGFDDELLYREISRPIQERAIPLQQLAHEEALGMMQAWATHPNRVPY
ncbi:MAG TPA: nucleoside deaminase [Polyangiaceae bacterium]|nr:nucleoside deaminase [Polyangiaceae bacterium]